MSIEHIRSLVREFVLEVHGKKKPSASVADIIKMIISNPNDSFDEIYAKVVKDHSNTRAQVKNIYDKKRHGDADPRTPDR